MLLESTHTCTDRHARMQKVYSGRSSANKFENNAINNGFNKPNKKKRRN